MKVIVGLGNPGDSYAKNMHNAGFMMVDEIAKHLHIASFREKFNAEFVKSSLDDNDFLLLKPMTYMNNSGQAVSACLKFFKIPPQQSLVIFDDLDLTLGKVRLRVNGGHGGHNGVKSIINHLGTQDFKRIRVGIGRPPGESQAKDYVLSNWTGASLKQLNAVQSQIVERVLRFIRGSSFENDSFGA